MAKTEVVDNFVWIDLENSSIPSMYVNKRNDWVFYGDENDYPDYLIKLANRHAEHNAILTAKCNFISGNGLKVDKNLNAEQAALIDKWIDRANRYETWQDLVPKITQDLEWFNGFYLQIVFGANGKPVEYYHIKFSNIRISKDGNTAYYCENWVDDKGKSNIRAEQDPSFKAFTMYNERLKAGTCIFQYKHSRPNAEKYGNTYPIPDYIGAIRDIEADANVTDHIYNKVTHGLTSNAILTIFGTDPGDKEKRKIAEGLKNNHAGKNNSGNFFLNFASEQSQGVEITTLDMPDAYKQFETIEPRNEKKIFTGHKVTSKTLFGIATEGALGQRTEMLMAFELFKKTYISIRQRILEDVIKYFARIADLEYSAIYLEGIEPLDTELPLDANSINEVMTTNEKRKYINEQYGSNLEEDIDTDQRLTLSRKLGQGATAELLRVIESQLPPEQKASILQVLFGLSEKKAKKMLQLPDQPEVNPQLKMSKEDEDAILTALELCAIPDNEDEVLEEEFIEHPDQVVTYDWEFNKHQKYEFLKGGVIETRKAILDLIAGNPFIKLEEIAKILGLDVDYIQEQLNGFIDRGLISESEDKLEMTPKGQSTAETLSPEVETEIYTVYKYVTRPDVPNAKSGSRPFCKRMMKRSDNGASWNREDIDRLSNQFDTSVWLYRGGFYHKPGGQTTAYCRHIWKAVTKIKRK